MELQIRTRFNEAWKAIVARKYHNKKSLSHQEYQDRLRKVRRLKRTWEENLEKMSLQKYLLLQKYDIAIKNGCERLVKPSPQRGVALDQCPLYVTDEELYDVLHQAYIVTNHSRKELMYKKIRDRYCNVTKEAVVTYLKMRQQVERTAIFPEVEQRLFPVPPSFQSQVNGITSVYFGFVDMHRYARDGYTCILVHWDIGTRYTDMVPLQSKHYVRVAVNLLKIYAKVGVPNFIDAACDIPYIKSIINYIKAVRCSENYCITTRSSEDRDAVRRGWNTIQNMMEPWMTNAECLRNWPQRLKYIEYRTNRNNFSGSALPQLDISPDDFHPSV